MSTHREFLGQREGQTCDAKQVNTRRQICQTLQGTSIALPQMNRAAHSVRFENQSRAKYGKPSVLSAAQESKIPSPTVRGRAETNPLPETGGAEVTRDTNSLNGVRGTCSSQAMTCNKANLTDQIETCILFLATC